MVEKKKSIYDLYTKRQRWLYLLLASAGCLQMPFSDTIYLPALTEIGDRFHSSQGIVALTVALFMFCVGIFALLWGPSSDYFGRVKTYHMATTLYIITNIVCMLAPSITVLIIFRALQGACVTAFLVVGSGVVADIFPVETRGMASGIYTTPALVGPVLGPILGGFLSQSEGWRSTFLLLIVIVGIGMVLLLRETNQYFVLKQLEIDNAQQAHLIQEFEEVTSHAPVFISPWKNLKLAFIPEFSPYIAVSAIQFGSFYSSLVLFSPVMSAAPYNYSEGDIGLLYIPAGVGALAGSMLGGKLADVGGNKWKNVPEARMLYGLIASMIFMVSGMQIYGWVLDARSNIAGVLIGQFLLGVGNGLFLPGILSYLSGQKQSIAAAAASASFSMNFLACGVATEVTVYIVDAINFGPLSIILSVCLFVSQMIAISIVLYKMHRKPATAPAQP